MKKSILFIAAILLSVHCMAQEQLSFPFQGGKEGMDKFFNDSLTVSQEIIQKKAIGTAVFKFNDIWIIPDREKTHDFIITFAFSFNAPATDSADLQKTVYDNYRTRKPITSTNQVPLNEATLLPNVVVNYDVAQ